MAGRGRGRNSTDNTNTNAEEQEQMSTETTEEVTEPTSAEDDMFSSTDEAPSDDDGMENPEPSNDAPSNDSASNEEKTSEPKRFDIPKNPADLKLSDDFAQVFGIRILEALGEIKAVDEILRAQESGDTEAAVVDYASGDDASQNIKAIFAEYKALRDQLNVALSQLTEAVKTEKGEVQLTPEEIAAKREERKALVTKAKQGLQAFSNFTTANGAAEDITLFIETLGTMIGRAPKSASGGNANYTQSTEVRPRLGSKQGGYIKVGDDKFTAFSMANRELIKKTGDKTVTVGQIHDAWANAAGVSLADWATIPKGTTVSFEIGNVPVEVHTEYDKADIGK